MYVHEVRNIQSPEKQDNIKKLLIFSLQFVKQASERKIFFVLLILFCTKLQITKIQDTSFLKIKTIFPLTKQSLTLSSTPIVMISSHSTIVGDIFLTGS